MSTSNGPSGRQIKPFAAVLQEIAKGQAHTRVSEAMAELTASVRDHQKKGTLTITVNVEPTKGTNDNLTVSVTHALKTPQETQASIFFVDDDANLVRSDPRQMQLPLRDASKETA